MTIDEMSNTPQIRLFASVYQILIRQEYDICLLMSGLPHKLSELQNDEGMTFLLRANRIELESLYLPEVKDSYEDAFATRGKKIAPDAAVAAAKLTAGYAFAFQSLGYELWETGEKEIAADTIAEVLPAYKKMLFRNAYQKIFAELSAKDKEFVIAIAKAYEDKMARISRVRAEGNIKSNYASVYRKRLLDSKLIQSPDYGYIRFTLPMFAEYIMTEVVPYLE